jgi:hypothetical protein
MATPTSSAKNSLHSHCCPCLPEPSVVAAVAWTDDDGRALSDMVVVIRLPPELQQGALLLPLPLLALGLTPSLPGTWWLGLSTSPTRTPVMRKRRWEETWAPAAWTATSQGRHSRARSSRQKK